MHSQQSEIIVEHGSICPKRILHKNNKKGFLIKRHNSIQQLAKGRPYQYESRWEYNRWKQQTTNSEASNEEQPKLLLLVFTSVKTVGIPRCSLESREYFDGQCNEQSIGTLFCKSNLNTTQLRLENNRSNETVAISPDHCTLIARLFGTERLFNRVQRRLKCSTMINKI